MRKFPFLVGVIVLAVIVAAVLVVILTSGEAERHCKNSERDAKGM